MQYMLICENSNSALVDRVNYFIKQGWEPQGGVSCSMSAVLDEITVQIWTQAMIIPDRLSITGTASEIKYVADNMEVPF